MPRSILLLCRVSGARRGKGRVQFGLEAPLDPRREPEAPQDRDQPPTTICASLSGGASSGTTVTKLRKCTPRKLTVIPLGSTVPSDLTAIGS